VNTGNFVFVIVDTGDHGGEILGFGMFQGGMKAQGRRERIKIDAAPA